MKTPLPVPSPCISVCLMDEKSGWCRGCMRSIGEIAGWATMDDERRLAVWRELGGRRVDLFGPQAAVTLPEWAR